jgi:uncharacterized iron-regulated protein
VIVLFLVITSESSLSSTQILKVSNKRTVEFKEFIADTGGADVIFIGETHDVKKQHEDQLDIIRALFANKVPLAVGLEMFSSDEQQHLDDWSSGKLKEQEFKAIYSMNWSFDWQLYRDIFIFARDNHIPMIGLNVPKSIIFKVVAQGPSALDDKDKKEIPTHIAWKLNASQNEYLEKIFSQVFGSNPMGISCFA